MTCRNFSFLANSTFFSGRSRKKSVRFYIVFEWWKFLFWKLTISCNALLSRNLFGRWKWFCTLKSMWYSCTRLSFLFNVKLWIENVLGAVRILHSNQEILIAFAFEIFEFEKRMCGMDVWIFPVKWKSFFFIFETWFSVCVRLSMDIWCCFLSASALIHANSRG